jgi:uncharacterized protein YjgD (DUF1641 family)
MTVLERIERRLARLESVVERVDSLARGAPALIATVTDTFDGVAQRAAEAVDLLRTPQPVGLWGAYRALKEPDVQRALGFLLGVARRFGASLSPKQLPARSSKGP